MHLWYHVVVKFSAATWSAKQIYYPHVYLSIYIYKDDLL